MKTLIEMILKYSHMNILPLNKLEELRLRPLSLAVAGSLA